MTFNFYLHSKIYKSGEQPIYLDLKHDYKRVRILLKISINPDLWNKKAQVVKNTRSFPQGFEINIQLAKIKAKAINIYNSYVSNFEKEPELKELKSLIQDAISGKKKKAEDDLITFYEEFNSTLDNKLNNKGRPFTKAYKSGVKITLVKLKDFIDDSNNSVEFRDIDMNFYNDFVSYLNTLDYKANYIGKQIKHIITVLNEATLLGKNTNLKFKEFKIIEEDSTEIYLNEEELEEMENLDLVIGSNEDFARDLFLFSAWTGLRYSDIAAFNDKADIKEKTFSFKVQKTQKPITIPILPVTRKILEKYNNKLPFLNNPRFNKLLKVIGEMMPSLKKVVILEYTKGGVLYSDEAIKHTLLKAHSGRRSFATNMVSRRMDIKLIMAITGHVTDSSFARYIKLSVGYQADQFLDEFNKM